MYFNYDILLIYLFPLLHLRTPHSALRSRANCCERWVGLGFDRHAVYNNAWIPLRTRSVSALFVCWWSLPLFFLLPPFATRVQICACALPIATLLPAPPWIGGSEAAGMAGGDGERRRRHSSGAMVPLALLIGEEARMEKMERPRIRYGCAAQSKKGEDYFLIRTDCCRVLGDPSSSFSVFAVCFRLRSPISVFFRTGAEFTRCCFSFDWLTWRRKPSLMSIWRYWYDRLVDTVVSIQLGSALDQEE